MKTLLITSALAVATVLSGAPASASPSFFPGTHKLIRGIPAVYQLPFIRGVAFQRKYMIRGIVVDRLINRGIVFGPQVRRVPVDRGF